MGKSKVFETHLKKREIFELHSLSKFTVEKTLLSLLPTLIYISPHSLSLSLSLKAVQFGINKTGNTKGGSITVSLTSCLTGLD
jgi:hypothetical protein